MSDRVTPEDVRDIPDDAEIMLVSYVRDGDHSSSLYGRANAYDCVKLLAHAAAVMYPELKAMVAQADHKKDASELTPKDLAHDILLHLRRWLDREEAGISDRRRNPPTPIADA